MSHSRWPAAKEITADDSRLLARRSPLIWVNRWSRTPSTRSAPAAAASSFGISSGRCWPSASSVTTAVKPLPKRSRKAVASAVPLPWLAGSDTTRAPACRAAAAVPSVDPSSTTSTSGSRRSTPATTAPTDAAAW